MLQRAVSFDWESLLPFVFFLLWGVSQLFGKKKPEAEEPADEDALERARQIREEIRRKIEARKQANAEARQQEYDPTLPDGQQRRLRPEPMAPQPAAQPQPVRREAPKPVQRESMPEVRRQKSLEEMLIEQRRQVEESRRKKKEALERAHEMEKRSRGSGKRARKPALARQADVVEVRSGLAFREQLLLGLRRPDSVRQAIVLREILDKPLGLR